MKTETKAILTVLIIIVIMVGMALYGYFTGAWDQPPT